jgi:hypothetical protein
MIPLKGDHYTKSHLGPVFKFRIRIIPAVIDPEFPALNRSCFVLFLFSRCQILRACLFGKDERKSLLEFQRENERNEIQLVFGD